MEQTIIMKGIALFATLIGVYQWMGQGASFYDIMVILFATALVISLDSKEKPQQETMSTNESGDNQKSIFQERASPKGLIQEGRNGLFFIKKSVLQPLYAFSY